MKYAVVVLCLVVASAAALPARPSRSSALDLFKDLEDIIQEDVKIFFGKLVNVIHHVEEPLTHLKEIVPEVNKEIHERIDELLAGLKRLAEKIQELIRKQSVLYGFDLLDNLTDLTGGTKLGTVLQLMSLADKTHKVINDAKEFVPHLKTTLEKMESRLEAHVTDFATHVLKELGLQNTLSQSVVKKIEDLFEKVEEEAHILLLDLLHKMEQTFEVLKEKLPEEYQKVKEAVKEVHSKIHELVEEIEQTLVFRSFNLLDIAGNVSGGTSLGTVFKVMSLIDKFNTVVQDVKNFGPRAEVVLQHSVKKVADSAQDFFSHAADKLVKI